VPCFLDNELGITKFPQDKSYSSLEDLNSTTNISNSYPNVQKILLPPILQSFGSDDLQTLVWEPHGRPLVPNRLLIWSGANDSNISSHSENHFILFTEEKTFRSFCDFLRATSAKITPSSLTTPEYTSQFFSNKQNLGLYIIASELSRCREHLREISLFMEQKVYYVLLANLPCRMTNALYRDYQALRIPKKHLPIPCLRSDIISA
jgi:hypothetical protein